MKSFFDLRQQNIEESSYTPKAQVGPVETDNAVDTPDINIGNLSTESLQQLNAYVGSIAYRDYMNPRTALEGLARKLSIVGLHFEPNAGLIETAIEEYPLSFMGGRYGMDIDGEVKEDDGIEPKIGHGLKLIVRYESLNNGLTSVNAEIVPS